MYAFPEWTACLAAADMPGVLLTFRNWWQRARAFAPHLAERVRVAEMVVTRPEHAVFLVEIVADTYAHYLENTDAAA